MMSAADAAAILAAFERLGIPVWVDGGWGIDALVGGQTRPHADLDLVIDRRNEASVVAALEPAGYAMTEDERPTRFVMQHAAGCQIDFHPLDFDGEGGGVQILQDGRSFCYPAEGLAGRGRIAGVSVRCLTADLQLRCHLGYTPDADDHHDMRLLRDRFGLCLPPPYAV